jgi:hypothetical protein
MLNEGTTPLPYEEAGTIIDESVCQIADFNVDEKVDIYNQELPFSELSVDVDNSNGYFSDFSETSIVDKLNKDAFIEFYFNIHETGWCKSWTMQFDSLKADNQKATLIFKPYVMSVYNSSLYDKNKYFNKTSWVVTQSESDFEQYFKDNYNIDVKVVLNISSTGVGIDIGRKGFNKVSNLLLYYGTFLGSSTLTNKAKMLVIDDNKQLYFWNIERDTPEMEMPYSFLLEKPLITRETLDEVKLNIHNVKSYTTDTYNYQKEISSTFINDVDTLVIYGENYDFSLLNTSDITITNGTLVSMTKSQTNTQDNGIHYIMLEISGNVGDSYTIKINAQLRHENVVEDKQSIQRKTNAVNVKNSITINYNAISNNNYWTTLLQKLDKKIQFRIPACPFLQVGDAIELTNEDETSEIYVITELHTSWNGGFIMEIIAYHLNN